MSLQVDVTQWGLNILSWIDSTGSIKITVPWEYMYMVFTLKSKHWVLET